MIYAGETVDATGDDTQIASSSFNESDIYLNDGVLLYKSTEGAGYVYSDNIFRGNSTNSTIKTVVDDWYILNVVSRGYSNYIAETLYCIDRDAYTEATGGNFGVRLTLSLKASILFAGGDRTQDNPYIVD